MSFAECNYRKLFSFTANYLKLLYYLSPIVFSGAKILSRMKTLKQQGGMEKHCKRVKSWMPMHI